MKGKGLIISVLLLALAGTTLAGNIPKIKRIERKPDLCEVIEEQRNLEKYFKEWIFPADTSGHYPITSPFGIRKNPVRKRTGGSYKQNHLGWDLGVYKEPVIAMADGIARRGYSKSEGRYIKITCDKGYYNSITQEYDTLKYEFLHLGKISVKNGEKIKKGKKVGISGNSGITNGAHLDFRISLNGKYIDPAIIFPYYQYFEEDK